jgi:hypothetical protein
MRATTIEGMLAKIRCASACAIRGKLDRIDGGSAETMALSIFDDLQQLAETA